MLDLGMPFLYPILKYNKYIASVLKIFILSVSICCALPAHAQRSLTIAYPDYWPFFSRSENGTMDGMFYEIISKAALNSKIRLQWNEYPWKRCQRYVQQGRADAMITVPTKERLEYSVTHPTPFYNKTMNIFTYAGHPKMGIINKIKNIDDLKASGLTVITYAGNGWNDKHIRSRGIKVQESHLREGVWPMLSRGRGDLIIEWPAGAWPDIDRQGLRKKIIQTDIVLESMPFHLLISKKSPYASSIGTISNTLADMKKNGSIQEIIHKY
ncbi:ABC transporter substrate-binding protein [Desulfovibrio sp. JC010]|uniref:substrate-binding periplasmic protein n=1 Tax=Desulfovibrio sp. JC010 TaxID=2593641 RepID=UPI0013D7C3E6|nr:transporter substrate-binding domain-containing protein [Desulfovibrio sp. JC010]NDV26374.1 transporter substrate-binding domain-containing protein [Desulfovibrio sp. JC010]